MLFINSGKIQYKYQYCQQCGICKIVCPKNAISFTQLKSALHEIHIDTNKCILCKKCVNICPANKKIDYEHYFDNFSKKKFQKGLLKISIIATSKQYIADVSIIDNDINKVVDILLDSSGCCAIDCNACLATKDSPRPVNEAPIPTAAADAIIDTEAIVTKFSIFYS